MHEVGRGIRIPPPPLLTADMLFHSLTFKVLGLEPDVRRTPR